MQNYNGKLRRGLLVFGGLLVLTIVEYIAAISGANVMLFLFILMIAKTAIILEYFMHLRAINSEDEEGH